MANPRKFSEKIALHTQKQAEETAAFEEIMREVMGATRTPNSTYSNHLPTPSFGPTRVGSLPNVNQIGQHNATADGKIDLQDCLNNLEEIKNGCLERSGSVRDGSCGRRNVSPMSRSPHRNSNQNLATVAASSPSYSSSNNVVNHNFQFSNSTHQKRSQSPYSTNKAYLSPPPPDGHWRRTNSDSALHQSTLATTNQTLDNFNQFGNMANNSPRRSPALQIDNSGNVTFSNATSPVSCPGTNGNSPEWDGHASKSINNPADNILLSASLPDQGQLRPRSCEVPGINIFPSQDENPESLANHHHIPISSSTGSLPDLTNLHFPVPLHAIDTDEQNGTQGGHMVNTANADPNSPYSNGPDSPFSPSSSHNSNLSPPPPCTMMAGYTSPGQQSPHQQTSPGPSPSPTSARRRAQHNVNNLVISNHRHQSMQGQVGYTQPNTTPPHIPPRAPSYLDETSPQYNRYQSPPRITVEGLAMDTSALNLNGNGVPFKQMNMTGINNHQMSPSATSDGTTMLNNSSASPQFQQQQQFHFNGNGQTFSNFAMGMHRSTTPTDSCSAPTSPASQNISPSNSPELPIISNVSTSTVSANQQFTSNSYSSYSNQQENILQHQLEQFRMTNDSETANYMQMSCGGDLNSPLQQQSGEQNSNVFYLESLNTSSLMNVSLNQFTDSVASMPNSNDSSSSPHAHAHLISSQNVTFTNDSVYFTPSQIPTLNIANNSSNHYKTDLSAAGMNMNNMYNSPQQQLSNSSHCTTPQTPSSIPDIILTGPNNLDELQSTTDFVKDLNNSSFDSLFGPGEEIRGGTFDSFDLDNLPILTCDIDSMQSNTD